MEEIKPIAMPGTHERFLAFFEEENLPRSARVLDVGAGHGAFTKRLYEMGYPVSACDLFPEHFQFTPVPCERVDITQDFPYPDAHFDVVIAIEVLEHVLDHAHFFAEIHRILSPGGKFYASTPNILSLKSRQRFLFSGFFYSFKPLDLHNYDGLQHVASRTLDQYNYLAVREGFEATEVAIDREQKGSIWLYVLLFPFLKLFIRLKKLTPIHNQRKLLLGRLLFLKFGKSD